MKKLFLLLFFTFTQNLMQCSTPGSSTKTSKRVSFASLPTKEDGQASPYAIDVETHRSTQLDNTNNPLKIHSKRKHQESLQQAEFEQQNKEQAALKKQNDRQHLVLTSMASLGIIVVFYAAWQEYQNQKP